MCAALKRPKTPRIALVPHTSKPPEACPHCGSRDLARRGTRRKKLEIVQLWRCAACKRAFTPSPAALRNKTYPLRVITEALTLYNLGHTREATVSKLNAKTGHVVSPTTIDTWLAAHADVLSYYRLRLRGRRLFTPQQIIRTIKLYHRQIYAYAYHRAKLAFLRDSTLDEKRAGSPASSTMRFAGLADFLERVPTACPHHLFRDDTSEASGSEAAATAPANAAARASQSKPSWADVRSIIVNTKENAATRAAALIIPATGDNRLRHERLQRFMLANDSVTLAMEVPIWLTEQDIAALERQHGLELIPHERDAGGALIPRVVTGHLDFLQVRNGAVHILDYKPNARTNKPVAQLTIYALALTRLVPGLRLFDIKCAWFNEHEYNEFFPRTLIAVARKNASGASPSQPTGGTMD